MEKILTSTVLVDTKDINILTYTAGPMVFIGSADTRQAGYSSIQGIVKLLHLVLCILYIYFRFSFWS